MVVLTEQNIDKFVWVHFSSGPYFSNGVFVYKAGDTGWVCYKEDVTNKVREVVMPKCLIQW